MIYSNMKNFYPINFHFMLQLNNVIGTRAFLLNIWNTYSVAVSIIFDELILKSIFLIQYYQWLII